MKVISSERIPIKMWLDEIEDGALEQAKNLANLPFSFKHIAIMPDSHQGYGMPIGGVLATKEIIIPNAVGVDIGCGMCAVKTPYNNISTSNLQKIIDKVKEDIPVGFNKHKFAQVEMECPTLAIPDHESIIVKEWGNARLQLGTLGGGNHFIEIQRGTDDLIWIMIHSGSRNLGKQVADYYNNRAKKLNDWWHVGIPKVWDLSFLPIDSKDGRAYLTEMEFCVKYALENRLAMMKKVCDIVVSTMKHRTIDLKNVINIAHNYAAFETHFGENVVVHRKGATSARIGELGIIPGSQGSKSYIVKGKGNKNSFESCSHGAGRKMGRKEAQRELNLTEEQNKLNKQGILHSIQTVKDLDEASGAYKDIDIVMEQQKDLVEIIEELTPLAVVKG